MLKFKRALGTVPPACKGDKSNTLRCPVVFGRECGKVTLIDMDCAAESTDCRMLGVNDERCDYLVFGRDTKTKRDLIVVLEVKSGKLNAPKAIRQIKAGLRHVTQLVWHTNKFIFYPVVVRKGPMSKIDREKLEEKGEVWLFGTKGEIRVVREKAHLPPRRKRDMAGLRGG